MIKSKRKIREGLTTANIQKKLVELDGVIFTDNKSKAKTGSN